MILLQPAFPGPAAFGGWAGESGGSLMSPALAENLFHQRHEAEWYEIEEVVPAPHPARPDGSARFTASQKTLWQPLCGPHVLVTWVKKIRRQRRKLDIPGNLIHHPVKPDGVFERWLSLVLAGNLELHPDELDGGRCSSSHHSGSRRRNGSLTARTGFSKTNDAPCRLVRQER